MKMFTTETEFLRLLRLECDRAEGGQSAVAKRLGFSPAFLCDVLKGRRAVTVALARRFGYQRYVVYEHLK